MGHFSAVVKVTQIFNQSITFNEHVTNVHAWSLEMTLR